MIAPLRVGVVGLRFGAGVHVPAFRSDPRCNVTAVAGRDPDRTAAVAHALGVQRSFSDWRELVASPDVDAVSVAVPPAEQPAIIAEAARLGKHVFCEKPLAASLADARTVVAHAASAGIVHAIDFMFPEIPAWCDAKVALSDGVIGRPLHFGYTWRVETYASRTDAPTWKNRPDQGGGAVGNFLPHVLYNIEWLLGSIRRPGRFVCSGGARLGRGVDGAVELESGVTGSISVSTDAPFGTGHALEIYGEDGALVLRNPGPDYAAGFELSVGTRTSQRFATVRPGFVSPGSDGRLEPVSRLAARFITAILDGGRMEPDLTDGLRVQEMLACAGQGVGSATGIGGPSPTSITV